MNDCEMLRKYGTGGGSAGKREWACSEVNACRCKAQCSYAETRTIRQIADQGVDRRVANHNHRTRGGISRELPTFSRETFVPLSPHKLVCICRTLFCCLFCVVGCLLGTRQADRES